MRSSTKSIGAASEPDFSSLDRSAASWLLRPVVWNSLLNTPWMVATDTTSSLMRVLRTSLPSTIFTSGRRSMYTTAIGLPTFSLVKSNMRWPPALLRRTDTVGEPLRWSKPVVAPTSWSPEAITRLLSRIGMGLPSGPRSRR